LLQDDAGDASGGGGAIYLSDAQYFWIGNSSFINN
jgi:hypothetical protein